MKNSDANQKPGNPKPQQRSDTQGSQKGSAQQGTGNAGSSGQAGNQAKRGEPLPADRKSDRSPKQENL